MASRRRLTRTDACLIKAIDLMGGMRALGRAIGTSHQNISGWRRIPAERVLDIEKATGISRHELRPDIYPVERKS